MRLRFGDVVVVDDRRQLTHAVKIITGTAKVELD